MNRSFQDPDRARVRSLWIGFAVFLVLVLVAILVFKIHSPSFGLFLTMFGTIIIIFQNRPMIWREGDTIVFRHPAKKTTKTKPAGAGIAKVVEWTGYEGTLYDVVWKDGDIWTIDGSHWVSLEYITSALKKSGLQEIPTQKDFMVYRRTPATSAA